MDIEKELQTLFNHPLTDISDKALALHNIPQDMRKAEAKRKQPDYYAQRKVCEDFARYQAGFQAVHQDLKTGKRSLVRTSKTDSMVEGRYYLVDGQLALLQSIGQTSTSSNGLKDGRTRCIYENGSEIDVLLQTFRKNVMSQGFAISDPVENPSGTSPRPQNLAEGDKVMGYIYVLRSCSADPQIARIADLYKIGFTTLPVEERIAHAAQDPTYLMAPVEVVAQYKIVNMHSQRFEQLIHQVFNAVQLQLKVTDSEGKVHHPREWFQVPLPVIDTVIEKITDGSILHYSYNPRLQCLEKHPATPQSTYNTQGLKILSLIIKQVYFDAILQGEKTIEYRKLKQTTLNKYTYLDPADGKRYLRRYDALRLLVGYHKDRESALVQVTHTTFSNGIVEYHLGSILEHLKP